MIKVQKGFPPFPTYKKEHIIFSGTSIPTAVSVSASTSAVNSISAGTSVLVVEGEYIHINCVKWNHEKLTIGQV